MSKRNWSQARHRARKSPEGRTAQLRIAGLVQEQAPPPAQVWAEYFARLMAAVLVERRRILEEAHREMPPAPITSTKVVYRADHIMNTHPAGKNGGPTREAATDPRWFLEGDVLGQAGPDWLRVRWDDGTEQLVCREHLCRKGSYLATDKLPPRVLVHVDEDGNPVLPPAPMRRVDPWVMDWGRE